MKKCLLPIVGGALLLFAGVSSADEDFPFALDHTQLDKTVVRVYCDGESGTSAREAMIIALQRAKELCGKQGFTHYYIVDSKTLYRRDSVTRQPSYTARGQVETRGTRIGSGGQMSGGAVDVDYDHGGMIRRNRGVYNRQGILVSENNPMFQGYSSKTYRDRQPWAAITVKMLKSDKSVSGKIVLPVNGAKEGKS